MKKLFTGWLFLLFMFCIAACGDKTISITLPEELGSGMSTQAEYDQFASENDFDSITVNEDGSVTYVMKESRHKELMEEIKTSIDEVLQDMTTSGDYPNFVSITANEDYSKFEVITKNTELDLTESFSTLGFFIFGQLYHAYNGTPVDNICVQYINEQTKEVVYEANSKDLEESDDTASETVEP